MGVKKSTFQYKDTVSVNRQSFLDNVVRNELLSKKDLRVLLHLMTYLDSLSYKGISKKRIAGDLNLNKSDVEKAINNLIEYSIIDEGTSISVDGGFKLLF